MSIDVKAFSKLEYPAQIRTLAKVLSSSDEAEKIQAREIMASRDFKIATSLHIEEEPVSSRANHGNGVPSIHDDFF